MQDKIFTGDNLSTLSDRRKMRRQEKVNSLFKRLASSFFAKEKTGSIITITRIASSKNLKSVKIFISIFPESKEKEVLNLLKGKVGELRRHIGSQIKMKFLPFFEIAIDEEEKARQKIDKILGTVAK